MSLPQRALLTTLDQVFGEQAATVLHTARRRARRPGLPVDALTALEFLRLYVSPPHAVDLRALFVAALARGEASGRERSAARTTVIVGVPAAGQQPRDPHAGGPR